MNSASIARRRRMNSPRILNLMLEHCLGKPAEQVQHRVMPAFTMHTVPQDNAEDAEVVEENKFSVPEPY